MSEIDDNSTFEEQHRFYMTQANESARALWLAGLKPSQIENVLGSGVCIDVYDLIRLLASPVPLLPDTRSRLQRVSDRLDMWWFHFRCDFGEWRWRAGRQIVRWWKP